MKSLNTIGEKEVDYVGKVFGLHVRVGVVKQRSVALLFDLGDNNRPGPGVRTSVAGELAHTSVGRRRRFVAGWARLFAKIDDQWVRERLVVLFM